MALTFTNADPRGRTDVAGSTRRASGVITFDSSYPTGGEAYTPALFGLATVHSIQVSPVSNNGAKLVVWDSANAKFLVYTALGAEAADTSNQSSVVANVTVWGL